jgi:hypothetical protein
MNITFSIDDQVVKDARKIAQDMGKSPKKSSRRVSVSFAAHCSGIFHLTNHSPAIAANCSRNAADRR